MNFNIILRPDDLLDCCNSQTDKSGCTTLEFSMSTFTRMDAKILRDELKVEALVEEEGTGKC